jgi:hypothetical protein
LGGGALPIHLGTDVRHLMPNSPGPELTRIPVRLRYKMCNFGSIHFIFIREQRS